MHILTVADAARLSVDDALDDGGVGEAAAFTHHLHAEAATGALELVEQGCHQLGARAAERVTERDRASVDVDLGEIGAGLFCPCEHD